MKKLIMRKGNVQKANLAAPPPRADTGGQMKKLSTPTPPARSSMKDEFSSLKEAALAVQRIRLSARHELELARKMRADAQRYQKETATKARSEAQHLILRTRLATQREIEELIRQASEEIQKLLADIRVIRISAQDELVALKRFTDAAKLSSMSLAIKGHYRKPAAKKKKQLATAK